MRAQPVVQMMLAALEDRARAGGLTSEPKAAGAADRASTPGARDRRAAMPAPSHLTAKWRAAPRTLGRAPVG